ncbi:hypothetical protein DSECCO2_473700 [anaerobic digester metagenome]
MGNGYLAFDPADSEATWDQDAIDPGQFMLQIIGDEAAFGIDPFDIQLLLFTCRRVHQGFSHTLVSILMLHILTADCDRNLAFSFGTICQEHLPVCEVDVALLHAKMLTDDCRQACLLIDEGDFIDALHVDRVDHIALRHVGKERDLAINLIIKALFAAAEQDIGLNTDLTQLVGTMLRGLCL